MKFERKVLLHGLTLCVLGASIVHAATPAEERAMLGKDMTPIGAERKGNAAGTIPEWTGGLSKVPAGITGVVTGTRYPDPFAADKPLATITAANVDQYKDTLTPGQIALLKRGDQERMVIYPTHRSCAYPEDIYRKTGQNVGKAPPVAGRKCAD